MKDISEELVGVGVFDLHGTDGFEHLVQPLLEEVVERLDVRPEQLPQRCILLRGGPTN
jgi:hypothetical protein